jgi:hypothetical protein
MIMAMRTITHITVMIMTGMATIPIRMPTIRMVRAR